jgi:RHS repeat-associated protein
VTNSYTYDPFGVTTETKALLTNVFNPWRYAGQYQDTTTGLYKMGARYYQPELGRWTQPDPSGAEANAYLYVGGNPVNFVDPTGLFSLADIGQAVLGAAAGVATAGFVTGAIAALAPPLAPFAGAIGACVGGAVGAVIGGGNSLMNAVLGCIGGNVGRALSQLGFTQEALAKLAEQIIKKF